jgi:hypothetical protein
MKHRPCSEKRIHSAIRITSLLLPCVLAACSDGGEVREGNAGAYLDTNRRIQLEGEALRGSVEGARRLMDHYTYAERDPYQLEIWSTVAITDGDKEIMPTLGSLLTTGQGADPNTYLVTRESCKRGRAMLEAAKKDGDVAAALLLKNISVDCDVKH